MEIRRSYDRLISTMGFPIPVRPHLYIESGPRKLKAHNRKVKKPFVIHNQYCGCWWPGSSCHQPTRSQVISNHGFDLVLPEDSSFSARVNTLASGEKNPRDPHFADDISKDISLNKNVWIWNKMSLKCEWHWWLETISLWNETWQEIPAEPIMDDKVCWAFNADHMALKS